MTKVVVPDASVAVKWLLQESDSHLAVALLYQSNILHAPTLLRIEVRAAIIRACRVGQIAELDARRLLADCAQMLSDVRIRYVPDAALLAEASEIALRIRHNLQDCIYIACAQRAAAELVTADLTLLKRAAGLPFVRGL